MSKQVVNGAILKCNFGTAPCTMIVTRHNVTGCGNKTATILDNTVQNVPTFVLCTTTGNPAVAAAAGIPQPCVPSLAPPWSPGKPKITIDGEVTLDSDSTLQCMYGGKISVTDPGEPKITLE